MIRVLIADDHPVVLTGIRRELENEVGVEIVGHAHDSGEIDDILGSVPCDVLVVDYSMPGGRLGDGLSMLQKLRRSYPKTSIVVITMLNNPALIQRILATGVASIVRKSDPLGFIKTAIRAAYKGHVYLPPPVQEMLDADELAVPRGEEKLSERELEVLRQCAAGIPIVEIARKTNRSAKTISSQKSVAMKKLGLNNDFELYQYALSHGLLGKSS